MLEVGDSVFGVPARISATVYPGSSGIVDIEREVNLGQPIHSKGVMILPATWVAATPRSSPGNLRQHCPGTIHGCVDGDSASLGEVCTLISALSRTPLKQCFAITGSINQFGEVQAVGGVNENRGFFRLCEARGLTGEQGVIIPRANVTTLMLDGACCRRCAPGSSTSTRCARWTRRWRCWWASRSVPRTRGTLPERQRERSGRGALAGDIRTRHGRDDKEKDKPAEKETVVAKDKAAAKKD